MTLSFQTTARQRTEREGERTPFDIDGEDFVAVRPKDEAFLLIVQASASQASLGDQVHAVFQFLDLALDPASGQRLRQRLLDPTDDVTVETLADVMRRLVERWTTDNPASPPPLPPAPPEPAPTKPAKRAASKTSPKRR